WRISADDASVSVLASTALGTTLAAAWPTVSKLFYDTQTGFAKRLLVIDLPSGTSEDLSATGGLSGFIGSASSGQTLDRSSSSVTLAGQLYFRASDGSGRAVWVLDPVSNATRVVPSSSGARLLAASGDDLYFITGAGDSVFTSSDPTVVLWRYSLSAN